MAAYVAINDWLANVENAADVDDDTFTIALTNTAPGSETPDPTGDGDGVLGSLTEVAYANLSSRNLILAGSSQAAGTYTLDFADLVLTSSGGTTGPFRYVYIYDDTVAVPADPLVCYFDYGSSITLQNGETFTITFSGSGLYTKA